MGTPFGQGNMEKSAYIFYASRQESLCQKTLILVPVLKVFNDLFRILCQENSEYAMRSIAP